METQAGRVTLGSWAPGQSMHYRSVAVHRWGLPVGSWALVLVLDRTA